MSQREAGMGGSYNDCMVGAEFLAARAGEVGGRFYFEVEVLDWFGKVSVGVAGTNLGPQCAFVGGDACSWGHWSFNGSGRHG